MKNQFRYGGWRYLSFIFLDLLLLILANLLGAWLYLRYQPNYGYTNYYPVILIMLAIDITVSFCLNTLDHVLRQNAMKELILGAKHVGASFVMLAVILFVARRGAQYSRVTVVLGYAFYYFLFVGAHIVWKKVIQRTYKRGKRKTAILMTTDRFVDEGLDELEKIGIDVRTIWLLKNIKKDEIREIPVVKTWEEVAAAICWNMLDKVYIYGLDHQMVPGYLIKACREMGLKFDLVDFNYRIIDIKTIQNEDPKYGSLSFLEGKRDIPFPIRRVYWITETEADLHRGFHAHKLNCQLLYCPYGIIDIILDDGQKRTTVTLNEPGKGLILMPGLWREMVWRKSGSVLCVLASEYYDAQEYIRDYDEFITYNKKYRAGADAPYK